MANNTARKWRHSNPQIRQRISEKFDLILNDLLDKQEDDLWPFLEKVRAEAEEKGFTDELLAQILDER
ncbi:hypothetical protein [Spirosoma aerolatum]|uniref:hypothetical protein n=1 Tax=Spirosoma aerolatum TaxID=1211326 RepID=UPI0012D317A6|nr:hypothetical protein [Spirosoma aerolatum]